METADIKRRVITSIERAKRAAAERRVRSDEAGRAYEAFLNQRAIPIFRQVANILRAEGFLFTVFTPAGGVRLMSDRAAQDYIELTLDTGGHESLVIGHASRSRGRRVVETEEALGDPATLTEEQVLSFLLRALEPLVER